MKSEKILILSAVLILGALVAFPDQVTAQDPGASAEVLNSVAPEPLPAENRINIQNRVGNFQENRGARQDTRQENREVRQDARQENREVRQTNRQENREIRQANRQERIETRQANIKERLETRKQNVAERRARLSENIKTRVNGRLDNIFQRFDNTTVRLQDFSDRIAERVGDNANAQALLDNADSLIEEAIADTEATKIALEGALDDEIGSGDVRELVSSVTESIKTAHSALIDVVEEIGVEDN